jgi:hypothetical protein
MKAGTVVVAVSTAFYTSSCWSASPPLRERRAWQQTVKETFDFTALAALLK